MDFLIKFPLTSLWLNFQVLTLQTHWNLRNTYEPRLLKVTESKDSKFIQASCGTKHTIALDTNGYIWFFGLKTSVGKTCNKTEEKQLTPIELEIPDSI